MVYYNRFEFLQLNALQIFITHPFYHSFMISQCFVSKWLEDKYVVAYQFLEMHKFSQFYSFISIALQCQNNQYITEKIVPKIYCYVFAIGLVKINVKQVNMC